MPCDRCTGSRWPGAGKDNWKTAAPQRWLSRQSAAAVAVPSIRPGSRWPGAGKDNWKTAAPQRWLSRQSLPIPTMITCSRAHWPATQARSSLAMAISCSQTLPAHPHPHPGPGAGTALPAPPLTAPQLDRLGPTTSPRSSRTPAPLRFPCSKRSAMPTTKSERGGNNSNYGLHHRRLFHRNRVPRSVAETTNQTNVNGN